MSSSLYQELQACLLEPEPRVSWLQLAPAEDSLSLCWSSRSSTLREKSFQMCTESLGSETGSEAGSDDLSISTNFEGRKPAPRNVFLSKELNRGGRLPPPLTTSGFHMRRHREEGRLVIEAMSMAPWESVFLVERSEGRIRVGVMREEEDEMERRRRRWKGAAMVKNRIQRGIVRLPGVKWEMANLQGQGSARKEAKRTKD